MRRGGEEKVGKGGGKREGESARGRECSHKMLPPALAQGSPATRIMRAVPNTAHLTSCVWRRVLKPAVRDATEAPQSSDVSHREGLAKYVYLLFLGRGGNSSEFMIAVYIRERQHT